MENINLDLRAYNPRTCFWYKPINLHRNFIHFFLESETTLARANSFVISCEYLHHNNSIQVTVHIVVYLTCRTQGRKHQSSMVSILYTFSIHSHGHSSWAQSPSLDRVPTICPHVRAHVITLSRFRMSRFILLIKSWPNYPCFLTYFSF